MFKELGSRIKNGKRHLKFKFKQNFFVYTVRSHQEKIEILEKLKGHFSSSIFIKINFYELYPGNNLN
jgi:hypothetical protein